MSRLFEVQAAGFDASDDSTDDLIFWVAAPTIGAVAEVISDTGAKLCGALPFTEDVADYVLPRDSMRLATRLLECASEYRNKNRGV